MQSIDIKFTPSMPILFFPKQGLLVRFLTPLKMLYGVPFSKAQFGGSVPGTSEAPNVDPVGCTGARTFGAGAGGCYERSGLAPRFSNSSMMQ